jgi:hypothetical protein
MLAQHLIALERVRKKKQTGSTEKRPYHDWPLRIRSVCFILLAVFIFISTVVFSFTIGHNRGYVSVIRTYEYTADASFARSLSGSAATDDHSAATDDHGGSSSTAHAFSLFGAISGLGVYAGTISVLIIVLAVQCVEYVFHLLHVITHDTPFNKMVQSIEKELMGVGFTAFAFKIMVDTTHFLDLEWFHALEYAGEHTARVVGHAVLLFPS